MLTRVVLLIFAGFLCRAQTPGNSLHGRVVSNSGEPLRKAEVRLTMNGQPVTAYATTTAPDGSFVFENIPPGTYLLSTNCNGYVRPRVKRVLVEAGRKPELVEVKMAAQAVITGHVVDEDGDPVPEAQVQVMTVNERRGGMMMLPTGNGMTNDLGEFRIAGLAKGQYIVSVTTGQSHEGGSVTRAGGEQAYPTMFYPGTADREQAKTIEVGEGAQLHDLDVQLKKARAFHVRGRVIKPENMDDHRMIFVTIMPKSEAGIGFIGGGMHSPTQDGTFDLGGVLPGSYVVSAMANSSDGKSHNAQAEVEVKDRDVEGLAISFVNGMNIEGEIHALRPPAGFRVSDVWVILNPQESHFGGSQSQRAPNGKFTMQNVAPGRYRVNTQIEGEDGYVKSVSYNGSELIGRELQVSAGESGGKIDVTVAFDTGEIEGVVQDASGAPKAGANVMFLREDEEPCGCSKSAISDKLGRYRVTGLAPGEYLATARVVDDEGDFAPGDSKEELRKSAAKVTVAAGGKQTLTVQMAK